MYNTAGEHIAAGEHARGKRTSTRVRLIGVNGTAVVFDVVASNAECALSTEGDACARTRLAPSITTLGRALDDADAYRCARTGIPRNFCTIGAGAVLSKLVE